MKQRCQAEPNESVPYPILSSLPQPRERGSFSTRLAPCQRASMPRVLDLGHMGQGYLQKPPSHSISEVQDCQEGLLGQGMLRRAWLLPPPSRLALARPQGPRRPGATFPCSCCWNSSWARSKSASTSSRWAAAFRCRTRASGQAPGRETRAQPGQGSLP